MHDCRHGRWKLRTRLRPATLKAVSGAWFLAIPTEGLDLFTQQAGALLIAAGERHREGELKLLQLVLTLHLRSCLEMAAWVGSGRPGGSGLRGGPGMGHGGLFGMQAMRESHG